MASAFSRVKCASVAMLAMAVLSATGVAALNVPPAPKLDRPIVDQTGTLNKEQLDTLSLQIAGGRQEKDYQMGILMVPSLEGSDIESYSLEVARTWGVGEKRKNNGVLLLIAKNDRKVRIEVGSGLEGDLTDAETGRIIRNVIAPAFKDEKYYEGVQKAVTSIQAQVEGKPDAASAETVAPGEFMELLAGIFFIGIGLLSWLVSILARTKSWWAGGILGGAVGLVVAAIVGWGTIPLIIAAILSVIGLFFDWAVSRNFHQRADRGERPSWWAGGTTLGGGGGGGSFGGGGFSGGGASGGW